eukprot:6951907-Lingulodinium_polyedra.AAC.1
MIYVVLGPWPPKTVDVLPPVAQNVCRGNALLADEQLRACGANPREETWVVAIDANAKYKDMETVPPFA